MDDDSESFASELTQTMDWANKVNAVYSTQSGVSCVYPTQSENSAAFPPATKSAHGAVSQTQLGDSIALSLQPCVRGVRF